MKQHTIATHVDQKYIGRVWHKGDQCVSSTGPLVIESTQPWINRPSNAKAPSFFKRNITMKNVRDVETAPTLNFVVSLKKS